MDRSPNADAGRGGPKNASDGTPQSEPVSVPARACCCLARPAATVDMLATMDRDAVDLLICWHHLHHARPALRTTGAAAFDTDGTSLLPRDWESDLERLLSESIV